jgi:hypothetical protein
MPILDFEGRKDFESSFNELFKYFITNIDESIHNKKEFKQIMTDKINVPKTNMYKIRDNFITDYIKNKLKMEEVEYVMIIEIFVQIINFFGDLLFFLDDFENNNFIREKDKEFLKRKIKLLKRIIYEFNYFLQCIYTVKTGTDKKFINGFKNLKERIKELIFKVNNDKEYEKELEARIKDIESKSEQEKAHELSETQAHDQYLLFFKAKLDLRKFKKIDETDYEDISKILRLHYESFIREAKVQRMGEINSIYKIQNNNNEIGIIIKIDNNANSFCGFINKLIKKDKLPSYLLGTTYLGFDKKFYDFHIEALNILSYPGNCINENSII